MERLKSIGSQMAAGASWMVLFKLLDRGMGVVSVIVLARLLVPADFGLIALSVSLIALLEVLGAFGLETALIQQANARRAHYDAVWTFNVLLGLATGLVAAALAAPAASFYGDPRVALVMLVLGAARAIQGFENVGVVAFRKEMQFDREFRFLLAKRLAPTLLVTIPLAFVLRDYWALLIGSFAGACIGVCLSYAMHPFRPRPSLAGLSGLMQFSKWLFVANVMDVVHSRLVDMILGRSAGTSAVGMLTVARELARLPRELVAPVHRAVFPGYVQLADDRERLRNGSLRVSAVLMLLVVPAGVGLCILAEPAVHILLGPQWSAVIPLVQILSINNVLSVLLSTAHHVNLAVGMAKSTTLILLFDLATTVLLLFWLVPSLGARGAAWALLLGSLLTAPLNLMLLSKAIRFGWTELVALFARPLAGALVMALAVLALQSSWPMPHAVSSQVAYAAVLAGVGAAVYCAVVYTLWRRSRDVTSAEAWMLGRARSVLVAAGGRLRIRPP